MNIINKYLATIIVLFWGSLSTHGQILDTLVALPGKGMVINSDTIFIDRTSVKEAMKILNIKEKPGLSHGIAHGINLTEGKEESWTFVNIDLEFKDITLEYEGETEADLQLQWITIPSAIDYVIEISDEIVLDGNNPDINSFFPKEKEYDFISSDSLTFNLYSHGISFKLEKEKFGKKLKEISVHHTIDSTFTNNSPLDLDAKLDPDGDGQLDYDFKLNPDSSQKN